VPFARFVVSLLVLIGLIAPILQTGVAAGAVAAEERNAALDLPAMMLTPADLAAAGWPEYRLAGFEDDTSGWQTFGDAASDSPAGNVVCCLEEVDRLDFELSHTSWKRQHRRLLARQDPDDPETANLVVISDVAEYADADGADKALTLLTNNESPLAISENFYGDRWETRIDNDGTRWVMAFRHEHLLGIVQVIALGGTFTPQQIYDVTGQLRQRMVSVLARPRAGLSGAALHLGGIDTPARWEGYLRLRKEDYPVYDESAEDTAARTETYADAVDVYNLQQTLVPAPGQPIPPYYVERIYRFPSEKSASAWMEALPQGLKEDVATSGGSFAAEQLADARTFGDESLTFKIEHDVDGGTAFGYRIYVRVGKDTARMHLDGGEEPPLAVVESLAEAQAACFEAGSCTRKASLPRDLPGAACPPVASTIAPDGTGASRQTGAVPMLGADPARTGAQPGPGPKGSPEELWRFAASGTSLIPIVANGLLYLNSQDYFESYAEFNIGILTALDTASGTQRWCVTTGGTDVDPAFGDGLVFTQADDSVAGHAQVFVVALSATTGAERWRSYIGSGWTESVAGVTVEDGTVYVATGSGSLFALDESTGVPRWLFEVVDLPETRQEELGLPAIAGDTVYVAGGNLLYGLDKETGEKRWRYGTDDKEDRLLIPTVAGDTVYVAGDHAVYAVAAESGEERWQYAVESTADKGLAVVDGVLYLGTGEYDDPTQPSLLAALNAESGDELWRLDLEGYVSTPAVVGDTVYVGTGVKHSDDRQEGAVLALAAADGEERWSFPVEGIANSPVVVDGRVYVAAKTILNSGPTQIVYAIGGTKGNDFAGDAE
jgi:outer membrane protein assembly factor BamB